MGEGQETENGELGELGVLQEMGQRRVGDARTCVGDAGTYLWVPACIPGDRLLWFGVPAVSKQERKASKRLGAESLAVSLLFFSFLRVGEVCL